MNSFELGFFTELEKIAGAGSGTLKGLLLGGLGGAGLSALLAAKGVDDLAIDVPGMGKFPMPNSPMHDSMLSNLLDEKLKTVGLGSTLLGGATGGVLGARSKHNLTQEMARRNELAEQYLQHLKGQGFMSKLKGLFGRK